MTALHRAGMFFGLLDELASDDRVTDIAVTCEGRVWADRGSGMREHILQVPFRSPQVVRDYAVQLCAQLGRRLDDACPIADASNMHGVRVHAVIAPLVPQGASISIRFPGSEVASLQRLAQLGMFPAGWISVLSGLVSKRAAVLITGGTGVGKTTLAKACLRSVMRMTVSSPWKRCGSLAILAMGIMFPWRRGKRTLKAKVRWAFPIW